MKKNEETKPTEATESADRINNDLVCVTLFGGPNHGERYRLKDNRVAFLRTVGGHYARVRGGSHDAFYWYECEPPWAVLIGDNYIPVERA